MQNTAQNRQSLLDIAIIRDGSIENIIAIADANGMTVTDDLAAGQLVETGNAEPIKKQIVARLEAYSAEPATGINSQDIALCPFGGIGYMQVEFDFIVS